MNFINFFFKIVEWFKIKILATLNFVWNKKIWILFIIIFFIISFFFYIYFFISPSIYISPNLFTNSGKAFIQACIDSSKLSSTLTINQKKQIADLIEEIFYKMSKKGTPFQIGFRFYFYKFKFIIKILWEINEIKQKSSQSVPDEKIQMISARIVEELLNYSRSHPASKVARLIFYYYKKLFYKNFFIRFLNYYNEMNFFIMFFLYKLC